MGRSKSSSSTTSQKIIHLPELHPRQQEIEDWPHRFKVVNAGRRFGKNILMHDQAVDYLLQGAPVGWGSPTYKNLTDDWRTLQETLSPITSRALEQERRIECVTGGVLEMWTLDNPNPIRGRHYKLWITNEAAQVRYLLPTWNEIIRPTLIDLAGDGIFGSTPNGINDFHAIYTLGQGGHDDWKSETFTSFDNPYIDPKELEALRETVSENQYKQEILAQFLLSDAAVFRNLEAALLAPYEEPADHKGHVIVGGSDWGRANDFTVLSLGCVDCGRQVAIDRFNQIDYHFQRQRLEALHHKWQVKRWMVELNSIGQPNFEELQRAGLPVIGFTTTLTSKQPLIEAYSLALERGDIQLLPDDAQRAELQAYEVKRTETGISKYSAPEGMHDDMVVAGALMWRQMQSTPRPRPTQRTRQQTDLENWLNQGSRR